MQTPRNSGGLDGKKRIVGFAVDARPGKISRGTDNPVAGELIVATNLAAPNKPAAAIDINFLARRRDECPRPDIRKPRACPAGACVDANITAGPGEWRGDDR